MGQPAERHGRRRLQRAWVGLLLVGCSITGCSLNSAATTTSPSPPAGLSDHQKAVDAAHQFLRRWTDPDGRVVRRDQGDDTVSEGQGYALLLAVAVGDPSTFARVWTWTREHLQQPNGLFAYHWSGGHVLDRTPAADADTQIAWALTLAGQRFHQPDYTADARRLATTIATVEAGYDDQGRVTLAAGPWAVAAGHPLTVEPGYWTPPANAALATLTGDLRWQNMTASDTSHLGQLTQGGTTLPPDWALLGQGPPRASPSPDGRTPAQYGPDAMRATVWNSCTPAGRDLVGRWWTLLSSTATQAPLALNLDGTVRTSSRVPLAAVAAAAAAQAAGHPITSRSLLDAGAETAAQYPTYYGDAWVALGRTLLTTRLLAECGSA